MSEIIKIDKKKEHGYAILSKDDWVYITQTNASCINLSGESFSEFLKDIDSIRSVQAKAVNQ